MNRVDGVLRPRLLAPAGLLLLLSCGGGSGGGGGGASARWVLVPENPAFVAYRDAADGGFPVAEQAPARFRPEDFESVGAPVAVPAGPPSVGGLCVFPAAFDLRELGRSTPSWAVTCPCGSCWTTATLGSLESNIAPADVRHLSTNHLQRNFLPGSACSEGAAADYAVPYLAAWRGPVDDADYDACAPGGTVLTPPPVRVHVQNVLFLPRRQGPLDLCWIKWALMNVGGLYASISKGWGIDEALDTQYDPLPGNEIHAVTIVGWDDAFDRNLFHCDLPSLPPDQRVPPGDGAFLVRDNAGPVAWGDGHFWVSYYHRSFAVSPVAFTGEPVGNYARNYQWDPQGTLDMLYVVPTDAASVAAWQGNVFTAQAEEYISAISFHESQEDAADYDVRVYLDPVGGPTSPGGPASSFQFSPPMRGYFTVPLPARVKVSKGQKFGVVLRGRERAHGWPTSVCLERPTHAGIHAAAGQGYVSTDGVSWQDLTTVSVLGSGGSVTQLTDTNLRIKAFTTPVLVASAEIVPGDLSVAWDLTNEGSEEIWAQPAGRQRVRIGGRYEDIGDEFLAQRWVDPLGDEHVAEDGWVYVPAGATIRALSGPLAVEMAEQVSWRAWLLDPADGLTVSPGVLQYINDLILTPLHVLSTDPANGAQVNTPAVPVLTVTFDAAVKVGPGLAGITVSSPSDAKGVFTSIAGNVLTIVPSSPLKGAVGEPGGKTWSLHVPKDAVLSASLGNPLISDLNVTFTVVGLN